MKPMTLTTASATEKTIGTLSFLMKAAQPRLLSTQSGGLVVVVVTNSDRYSNRKARPPARTPRNIIYTWYIIYMVGKVNIVLVPD